MSSGPSSQPPSFNPYAVTSAPPYAAQGIPGQAGSIYQSGKWLIVEKSAYLPGRCVWLGGTCSEFRDPFPVWPYPY